MSHSYEVLAPRATRQFQCTQTQCPDSCCQHLHVKVDRSSFEMYTTNLALIPLMQDYLEDNPNDAEREAFPALLKKSQETQTCPLYEHDDPLCILKRDFGEEVMPAFCATYPREIAALGPDLYVGVSESCTQVARQLVEDPDALALEFGPYALDERATANPVSNDLAPDHAARYQSLQAVLTFLRHRDLPLEQRLFISGLYLSRAQALLANGEGVEAMQKLTNLFFQLVNENYFAEQARKMASESHNAIGLILFRTLAAKAGRGLLKDEINNLVHGLQIAEGDAFDIEHLARLNQGERRHLQPLLERQPHALENLLVNWLLNEQMPLRYDNLEIAWCSLTARYLVFKTLLSGIGLHQGHLDEDDVARVVYQFARSANDSGLQRELLAALEEHQLLSVQALFQALNLESAC